MRGLTIMVATADPARFHAALSLAAAQAALGGNARLYLHGEAVALLTKSDEGSRYAQAGMPGLTELREEAAALGVTILACQSGFALAGLDLSDAGPAVEAGGLIRLLGALGDDRLVVI
ncbi:MAG TPA: DsrE family protein [Allosphingosinicella sp.]|jgi:predicted peroxiredoxin